jgi:type II secretory ATPase GspE/PulE/Tfp pilus assembly ATPase PilB-like protein
VDSENEIPPATDRAARKTLGDRLLEEKLINRKQLANAQAMQQQHGGKLGDILLNQGVITPEQLAAVLSIHLNLPLIDLKRHAVQERALHLVPEEVARKHMLIPLDIVNDSLMIVMADPEDVRTVEDVKTQAGMRVEVALGVQSDIERAIDLNYRARESIDKKVEKMAPSPDKKAEDTALLSARTPVAETLDLMIAQAVKDRASDIHIEPQEDRLRVRYRIDGILHEMYSFPLSIHNPLLSRIKILSGLDISEQRRPQDGQFSIKITDKDIDIRTATMETPYGERATLRILDRTLSLYTLAELGFQPDVLKKYRELLKSPFGMILAGGPTGSGKTTTLYASINELDRNELNIMTIEDPIEYSFMDINQSQVNAKAGITFASGLRAIMRHDPNVILVGEIRDKETVTTAAQAALTGHLVLSSIHANDAVGVLFRLMDLQADPASISSTLIAVVAQRMVRRICTNCRTPYRLTEEDLQAVSRELSPPFPTFYTGAGCNLCAGTGYRGRIGIFELLIMSETIRNMLRDGGAASAMKERAIAEGMVTMRRDGMRKAADGITSVSEVMRNVFSVGN